MLHDDRLACWARFQVRGPAALLVLAAAVVGAGMLGAVGGWVGWHGASAPYLTVRQAAALAGPALPASRPVAATRYIAP
jgi:hypothetical protein